MYIEYPAIYDSMARAAHCLIAGTTGAGKSTALNGFLYRLAADSPRRVQWFLIDPKRVELRDLQKLPHCGGYAADYAGIDRLIARAHNTMIQRYKTMPPGQKVYPGPDLYIVIDEYVDLKMYCSKATIQSINHISSLGRAAKVHLVLCTQRPTKDTLTPLLKDNLPCKLALATESPQQSKYLTGGPAAYGLPIGSALFYTPERPGIWSREKIDLVTPEQWQIIFNHWTPARRPGILDKLKAAIMPA